MATEFYTYAQKKRDSVLLIGYRDGKKFQTEHSFIPSVFVPVVGNVKNMATHETIYGQPLMEKTFEDGFQRKKFVKEMPEGSCSFFHRELYQFLIERYGSTMDVDYNLIKTAFIDIEATCENGFPDISNPQEQINAITLKIEDRCWCFGLEAITVDPKKFGIELEFEYFVFKDEYSLLKAFVKIFSDQAPDIVTGWNIEFFDLPYIIARGRKILGDSLISELSPVHSVDLFEVEKFNQKQMAGEIVGVATLDFIDLYKKFTYTKQPSYSLDYISEAELGERKLHDDDPTPMHLRYKTDYQQFIHYNVKDVELVWKLERKLKLITLAQLLAYQSKVLFGDVMSQVRTWEVFIANYLWQKGIVMPSESSSSGQREKIEGAYVMDPIIGRMQNWIVSFDLDSLYPNLMRVFNISPEKLVTSNDEFQSILQQSDTKIALDLMMGRGGLTPEKVVDLNAPVIPKHIPYAISVNNQLFRNDSPGVFAQIIKDLYKKRKEAKAKMIQARGDAEKIKIRINSGEDSPELQALLKKYQGEEVIFDNEQMARKIALNSLYGALGNPHFIFYDRRLAEAVTLSGQAALMWIRARINEFMSNITGVQGEYVVYADTDSAYISCEHLVNKFVPAGSSNEKITNFLDKVCSEKLTKHISKEYERLCEYLNAAEMALSMKREAISTKAFWCAKKKYACQVMDNEGVRYATPKIKVTGLESVRSDRSDMVREALDSCIELMFDGGEISVREFYSKFYTRFMSLSAEEIATPKGVRGIGKWSTPQGNGIRNPISGTPMQVKAAINYNNMLIKKGVSHLYPEIKDGGKIKILKLKEQNPTRMDCIGFLNELPKEFGLHQHIDYIEHFDSFLSPLNSFLVAVGWTLRKMNNLNSLFDDE